MAWLLTFFLMMGASVAQNLQFDVKDRCVPLQDFSKSQQDVILYAYQYGKNYGFGYTMAAIAWKESCAGEYLINFSDPSAGIYHAYIPGVIKKYTRYRDSIFLRNVVGQMLVSNPEFASSIALDHLRYWQKVRNGDFEKIVKSYNKGFSWEKSTSSNRLANSYYLDIVDRVKQLQDYIPLYISSYKLRPPSKSIDRIKPDESGTVRDGRFYPHSSSAKSPTFYLMQER